jgi:uncharacterized membrane protein YbhN (UPF0104 family)
LIISALLLAATAVIIEIWLGWARVVEPWRAIPWDGALTAVGLVACSYCLRAWRIYDFFLAQTKGRYVLCLRLTLIHNLLNNLLPARSGELSFPLLMQRYFSVELSGSLPALLWLRLLDLHFLLLLLVVASYSFFDTSLVVIAALLVLPMPLLAYALQHRLRQWCAASAERSNRTRAHKLLLVLPTTSRELLRGLLLTWSNWSLKLAAFSWLLALFADTSMTHALAGAVAGELASVLPINTPAGIGIYEAGVVAGMVPLGVAADTALVAAINLHIFLLVCAGAGAASAWVIPASPLAREKT